MWDKRAVLVKVTDGDTVVMTLDQGFDDVKENMRVRLFGVYAPESKEPGGPETKAFVESWFKEHTVSTKRFNFLVTTIRTPRSDTEVKTLDRYVCVVETLDHAYNLNIDVQTFVTAQGYLGGIGSI